MTYSRRDFLKSMTGAPALLSLAPTLPAFLQRAALAAGEGSPTGENVLIVLQLSGGNDGLNMIVPYADDAFQRSRITLRLSQSQVLPIDSYLGFHPALTGLHQLFQQGTVTVVQGVGVPQNNRDHDLAMREWHTGQPGEPLCPTGWIGRAVDRVAAPGTAQFPALFVGPIAMPFALNAELSVVPSLVHIRQLTRTTPPGTSAETVDTAPAQPAAAAGADGPLLAAVARAAAAARTMSERIEAALAADASTGEYPAYTLAQQLRMVAQLIRADLGIRIYFVELGGGGIGGFDNHANQRDNHAALLREMSDSIAALMNDLARERLVSRTLLMSFSEFGRTVTENGRRGTDHGAAAPVLLVGGRVRGGLCGQHPSLTDLDQDALKFHIDYRRLYATMLQQWLGLDAQAILGQAFEPIDVVG